MKTPHKHAELIKAWADGAEIVIRWRADEPWQNCTAPRWDQDCEYRIKPEPKPDTVMYVDAEHEFLTVSAIKKLTCNLKLTFDGETGKLKAAEVLV